MPDADDDAILALILAERLAARERGEPLAPEALERRFPGREALIARLWREIDTAEPPTPPDGEAARIGHYRLLRLLGRGGQGEVHLAVDERFGRQVALKTLRGLDVASLEAVERLRREAEIASRLDHPAICPVYDAGVAGGVPFIVMRYVEGTTLARLVAGAAREPRTRPERDGHAATETALPRIDPGILRARLGILEEVARAVHVAHEAGFIHRDLKPANVMVEPSGRPVILDFGIACALDIEEIGSTLTQDVLGTPAYLAPELLQASPLRHDRQTDVYALGVTLFEAVTSRRPFTGATREGLCRSILEEAPPDPGSFVRGLTRDLRVLILTAIERDRGRRYATARDLADEIGCVLAGTPIVARPLGPLGRSLRAARRHPARTAAFALSLVLVALAGFAAARWPSVRADLAAARLQKAEVLRELQVEAGFAALADDAADRAAEIFLEVLREEPACVEAVIGRSQALIAARRAEEALEFLDGQEDLEAVEPALSWVRQNALRELGRGGEALAIVGRLGEPVGEHALLASALNHIRWGMLGGRAAALRAVELMQRCVLAAPAARPLHLDSLAWAAGVAEDEALSLRVAEILVDRWPERARSWYWRSYVLKKLDPEAALVACAEALGRDPLYVSPRVVQAQLLASRGDTAEALAILGEAQRLQPGNAALFQLQGELHLQRREFPEARGCFETVLARAPGLSRPLIGLGLSFLKERRFEEALAFFADASRCEPETASAHSNLALARYHTLDFAGALAAAQRALELDPRHAEPHNLLGMSLEALGRPGEAIPHFEEALRLRPRYVQAMVHRASCQADLGRFREARRLLSQAREEIDRSPGLDDLPEGPVREIERLAELEERLEALASGRELVDSGPEFLELVEIAERRQEPARVVALLAEAFRLDPGLAASHRWRALRAAARHLAGPAAPGRGPERARTRSRALAREWLEAELVALEERVARGELGSRRGCGILEAWLADPDLASLRSPSATGPGDGACAVELLRLWERVEARADAWGR